MGERGVFHGIDGEGDVEGRVHDGCVVDERGVRTLIDVKARGGSGQISEQTAEEAT